MELQDFALDTYGGYGTEALQHVIDQVSEDISENHGFVYPETSAKRLPRARLLGPVVIGGEIGVPFYTKGVPTLLYYGLGDISTVVDTNTNVHTIVPTTSIPAFRMGVGKDINEHRFVGCAIKSIKIDYTIGEAALVTFDTLVRKELTPGVIATPTFPDYDELERAFLGTEVDVLLGGVANVDIRSFSLEINNKLVEDNHTFGSRFIPALICQNLTITGSLTMSFTSIDEYQDALAEIQKALVLTFTHGVAASSTERKIVITLRQLSFDESKLPTDSNKEYILELNFTAEIDPLVDQDALIIEITNEETAVQVAA
jgi:hypothetical protein